MPTVKNPARIMSPEQREAMFAREKQVLDLRTTGMSFAKIEKQLKITDAHGVYKRAMSRDQNIEYKRAEALRLEEARLDALQEGIWGRAVGGDARAVEVALKVLERRSKMLGMDFQDLVAGQMVEIEQAKVELMAVALGETLRMLGLPPSDVQAGVSFFLNKIRDGHANARPLELPYKEDIVDADVVLDDSDMALL